MYDQAADLLPPTLSDDIDIFPREIAPGRVVLLEDGRIGIIDYVWQSPYYGESQVDRAYVVGMNQEFADWVLPAQIAHIYGVVGNVQPVVVRREASALYDAPALPGGDPNVNVITKEAYIAWLINECKKRGFDPSGVAENATEAAFSA